MAPVAPTGQECSKPASVSSHPLGISSGFIFMINRTEAFRAASATPPLEMSERGDSKRSRRGTGRQTTGTSSSNDLPRNVAATAPIKPAHRGHHDGNDSSSDDDGDHHGKNNGCRPVDYSIATYLAKMEKVNESIQRISRYSDEIDRLHRQVLTAVNVEEASKYSHSIDELTAHVNEQANNARRILVGASEENKFLLDNPKVVSTSDMRMRRTQQTRHAKKFMEVMKKYQEMQTNYKGRYKGQLERQYLIVKPNATREELDRLTDSDGAAVLTQQMFSMANRSLAKKQLDEMKERHHDILAIEKSIQELHQMFLDMALLVDQQGELIDRVGEHVEASAEYTAKAAVQMEAAVSSKRRSQRCKWIMLGILLFIIIGVGIYLAILFGTGKSSGGSSAPSSAPPPPPPAPPAPAPASPGPGPARAPAPAPVAPPPAGGQPQQQSTGPVKKRNRPNVVLNFDDQSKANDLNNSILENADAPREPDTEISKKATRDIYHKNRRHRYHS